MWYHIYNTYTHRHGRRPGCTLANAQRRCPPVVCMCVCVHTCRRNVPWLCVRRDDCVVSSLSLIIPTNHATGALLSLALITRYRTIARRVFKRMQPVWSFIVFNFLRTRWYRYSGTRHTLTSQTNAADCWTEWEIGKTRNAGLPFESSYCACAVSIYTCKW